MQCFDTKPDLMVPLAAWANPDVRVVSTINGIGLLYSLRSPVALALRPVNETLQRLAAQKTAVTVFQNRDDEAFFLKKRLLGRSAHLIIPGSGVAVDQFDKAVAAGPPAHRAATIAGLEGCEVVKTVTRMTRQKGDTDSSQGGRAGASATARRALPANPTARGRRSVRRDAGRN